MPNFSTATKPNIKYLEDHPRFQGNRTERPSTIDMDAPIAIILPESARGGFTARHMGGDKAKIGGDYFLRDDRPKNIFVRLCRLLTGQPSKD